MAIVTGYYYSHYDSDLDTGNSFNHIVGGDAYNYIIMGARATMWMGLGIIFTIIATGLLIGYFILFKNETLNSPIHLEKINEDEIDESSNVSTALVTKYKTTGDKALDEFVLHHQGDNGDPDWGDPNDKANDNYWEDDKIYNELNNLIYEGRKRKTLY